MDAIIEDLQASDTKARVRALEALLLELRAQAELRLLEVTHSLTHSLIKSSLTVYATLYSPGRSSA
jgi:hypothetical protein